MILMTQEVRLSGEFPSEPSQMKTLEISLRSEQQTYIFNVIGSLPDVEKFLSPIIQQCLTPLSTVELNELIDGLKNREPFKSLLNEESSTTSS